MNDRNSTLNRKSTRIRRTSFHLEPGPRAGTIDAILSYSKAVSVVEAPPVGTIVVVLN